MQRNFSAARLVHSPRPLSPGVRKDGFTLVEMLVAISITLVLMATVVSLFATVSSSVSKRRAAIEVGNQLRHVRNVLQRDLEGATCPLIPWQKPESNHGYFEIVEGLHADFYPSLLTDGVGTPTNPEIDHATSTIPSSNLGFDQVAGQQDWKTDGGGLGDYDDILAFTSRNESEPFSGLAPTNNIDTANNNQRPFDKWQSQVVKSPVAEVVWYCIESPTTDTGGYFGNASLAGFRTIYRRTLIVAPWLDYRYNVDTNGSKSRPGVLRIINRANVTEQQALAALIAFQERYDISARIEFDPTIDAPDGRWTIVANTLSDLTKRENRYEHHGIVGDSTTGSRNFPYVMASAGGNPTSSVTFVSDPEYGASGAGTTASPLPEGNAVVGYNVTNRGSGYIIRPLAILEGGATARAIVNESGQVVHVTKGLVPLGVTSSSTSRRGEDLIMSQALAFDVQVFDPAAPIYLDTQTETALTPGDIGWAAASGSGASVVSQGAYVDLGYDVLHNEVRRRTGGSGTDVLVSTPFSGLANGKSNLLDGRLTRVYDTWNYGYETDGVDQDGNTLVDEGADGFDLLEQDLNSDGVLDGIRGVDDMGERETSPPYPTPLRAIQVKLRVYEPDSRQIREVTVRQHFVPE